MAYGFAPQSERPSTYRRHARSPEALAPQLRELKSSFLAQFASLEDPRVERSQLHYFIDIILIGILCVIAGGKGWEDMENYGISKQEWLEKFLALPNGIPSADTFRRVFSRLNPKTFEHCLIRWVSSLAEALGAEVVAIDGKTRTRLLVVCQELIDGYSRFNLIRASSVVNCQSALEEI